MTQFIGIDPGSPEGDKTAYIPYSICNNITDPDLAGLLDYLERDMGWDIEIRNNDPHKTWYIAHIDGISYIAIIFNQDGDVDINKFSIFGSATGIARYATIEKKILFRTYRSLLPVIRDLYYK